MVLDCLKPLTRGRSASARDSISTCPAAAMRQEERRRTRRVTLFLTLCSVCMLLNFLCRQCLASVMVPMAREFSWDKSTQGFVLQAFYWGYAPAQLLGGWLADAMGGQMVLLAGIIVWSAATALTPLSVKIGGLPLIFLVRLVVGASQGVAFPAINAMIGKYVPSNLHSIAAASTTAAAYPGVVLAFFITPLLVESQLLGGWPLVFYVYAVMAVPWIPLWLATSPRRRLPHNTTKNHHRQDDSSPSSSPLLSHQDHHQDHTNGTKAAAAHPPLGGSLYDEEATTPWRDEEQGISASAAAAGDISPTMPCLARRTSKPEDGRRRRGGALHGEMGVLVDFLQHRSVWALLIAQYCHCWPLIGLLNWLPVFVSDRYHVAMSGLGYYTCVPYIVQSCTGFAAGTLADHLINVARWRVRTVRRVLQVFAMVGAATGLLGVGFVASTPLEATLFLSLAAGCHAFAYGAMCANHLDLAPSKAGLLFSAGNTCGMVGGLVAVPAVGFVLEKAHEYGLSDAHRWGAVFALFAAHYLVGASVWMSWCSDKRIDSEHRCRQEQPPSPAAAAAALAGGARGRRVGA
ncbi:unnamed protein product [Vitrella brassicaformis CCMP3155]|uniref:Major facilitator superfamily (MFS) profile domain-containing protein n=2 Tax=Vitrella brassicaformis TaxID=1169539 RepID=A0A0G4FB60_VITBC|nr:unnamed protein product [Vitrella brassicaformis CCMP3155]|eukprot:CEM09879.1 unnamed protein product [Vitrella brassicaformis CCMP3155]